MVVSASPRPATQRMVASMSCARRSSGAAVRPCFLAGRRRLDCWMESGKTSARLRPRGHLEGDTNRFRAHFNE
jgi:hypothetical protein